MNFLTITHTKSVSQDNHRATECDNSCTVDWIFGYNTPCTC